MTHLHLQNVYDCWDVVNGKSCSCWDCEQITCPAKVDTTTENWVYTLPVGLGLSLAWMVFIGVLTFLHKPKLTKTGEL